VNTGCCKRAALSSGSATNSYHILMQPTHITDYLKRNAAQFPDKLALSSAGRNLTWRQLTAEVEKRAGFFVRELGSDSQRVAALLMPNSWELVVAYLAILEAGHIALPIDVIYKPLEIGAVLNQMKPQLTVTDTPNLERVGGHPAVSFERIEELPTKGGLRLAASEQIASLVFTSGTTGTPKAASCSHANHIWNIEVCSQAWGWGSDDTMLLSLRLAHWYGICMGLSGAIYHGNTLFLEDHFDARATLQRLSRGDISLFTHTPIAFTRLLEIDGDFDLSGVRLPISGSAALAPDIWQRFKQKFGLEIIECYGSSETGRIASNLSGDRRTGTPGLPLDGVQVKLDEHKELLVKSPGLFPGYFNNPAATAKNLTSDGFWRTGDLARIEDGRIYLRGRVQERIRKFGYSVSPRDVEWALRENPSVEDCLVIGAPGEDADNNRLVYFVVGNIDEDELKNYTKDNLPSIWRPDKVIFLNHIYRRPNGKPDLAKLRSLI
jgi:acyl-CoA synthetase (AMP-forming)/AMP-acid ligase II